MLFSISLKPAWAQIAHLFKFCVKVVKHLKRYLRVKVFFRCLTDPGARDSLKKTCSCSFIESEHVILFLAATHRQQNVTKLVKNNSFFNDTKPQNLLFYASQVIID